MSLALNRDWLKRGWALACLVIASVLIVIGALLLAGANPGHALLDLVNSSIGKPVAISGTLREVTPLLISGIAVFLGLKAGLFNIGVEGQFTVGALVAAVVGLRVPGSVGIGVAMLAGMLGGALWALPAGAIKAYKGGHEVITTIMLNNIAGLLSTAMVAGPVKEAHAGSPMTATLPESSRLPDLLTISGLQINAGLILGILVAVGLWWYLRSTVSGYELQAVGANATAAKFAGIDTRRVIMSTMFWSGAIGGLAGAVQVLAKEFYFYPGLSSGYGFDALGVAMLAGATPLGLLLSAALFGILNKGGTSMQILDQVPKGITTVILGMLIVIAAAVRYRKAGAPVD